MRTLSTLGLALCIAVLTGLHTPAADWPQWRGPDRTAVSAETGLLKTWPAGGPKLLWTFDKAGLGYACFAVVGGKLFTMGARGEDEYVFCLDEKGQEAWATKIGKVFDFKGNAWSRGPNATPTVDGERVFALGSQGVLVCVNKADGKEVWRKDLPKELAAEVNNDAPGGEKKFGWGYCWSPLVDGDQLICVPGGPQGLFAALDKASGKVLWRSKGVTDQATYSSPIVAEIGKVRQYIYLLQEGVVGVSAKDGELLWRHKRDNTDDVVCPTPVSEGNMVYVTVGVGGGCELLKLTPEGKKFKVEAAYSEKAIANKQGGMVKVGKYLYGYHEERAWMCQEFETGKLGKWPKREAPNALKAGGVVAADGRLYVLDETGTAGMIKINPDKYEEVSRFTLPRLSKLRKASGRVWTHPVLADGKLYLRDQEFIFCYQVK
jgi:outer membrane protein assembly factor BamB